MSIIVIFFEKGFCDAENIEVYATWDGMSKVSHLQSVKSKNAKNLRSGKLNASP